MTDTWTTPVTWANEDLFHSDDGNSFVRDNIIFLNNALSSSALIDLDIPTVTAVPADHSVGWRDIETFNFTTYGKEIYASLEFDVVAGVDVWAPGTVVVSSNDYTDKVERVGDTILKVRVRKGPDNPEEYARWDREYRVLVDRVAEAWTRWQRALTRGWPGDTELAMSRKAELDALRAERDRVLDNVRSARGDRFKTIFNAGSGRTIIESSQTSTTRVVTSAFTERYEEATLRLLFSVRNEEGVVEELSRELLDREQGGIVTSGAFYLVNVPAGQHEVKLQWNSPQFDGHTPTDSHTLISLRNVNLQIKEVRYRLLDRES